MRILVTGGAGFIGSAVVRQAIATGLKIVNVDKMGYAASHLNVAGVANRSQYRFEKADVRDRAAMKHLLHEYAPDAVIHLAAESHVDRSIDDPEAFLSNNITGTFSLLEAARDYWQVSGPRRFFRFLHVSTDEVYGSLDPGCEAREAAPLGPASPYSASKAASDHLALAWHRTYGLPVIVSRSSNNYGPCQHPEKLIPMVVLNASEGREIPVYGTGANLRDWLFVEDHARALLRIVADGSPGETYNVGSNAARANIDVVRALCEILDQKRPPGAPHGRLIDFVADRPGHDLRYSMDWTKIRRDLDWEPSTRFEIGLEATVDWYLASPGWVAAARQRGFRPVRRGLAGGR
ncbi:MAG: dTDP-glucose 4,6-dehydratase [Paracoccaceae bacterium]